MPASDSVERFALHNMEDCEYKNKICFIKKKKP